MVTFSVVVSSNTKPKNTLQKRIITSCAAETVRYMAEQQKSVERYHEYNTCTISRMHNPATNILYSVVVQYYAMLEFQVGCAGVTGVHSNQAYRKVASHE